MRRHSAARRSPDTPGALRVIQIKVSRLETADTSFHSGRPARFLVSHVTAGQAGGYAEGVGFLFPLFRVLPRRFQTPGPPGHGRKDMIRFRFTLALILSALVAPAKAGEFVDYGTQHQLPVPAIGKIGSGPQYNMIQLHICGGGAVMRGVHIGANQFLCAEEVQFATGSGVVQLPVTVPFSSIVSNMQGPFRSYQDFRLKGIASCPPMHVMVGLHAGRNILACAPVRPQAYRGGAMLEWTTTLDFNTSERVGNTSMHTCPRGSLMVGIHIARNVLICGRYMVPGT